MSISSYDPLSHTEGDSVLLIAPAGAKEDTGVCSELLTAGPLDELNVLLITLTDVVTDAGSYWESITDSSPPANKHVIRTGSNLDSNTRDRLGSGSEDVTVISDPANLTQFGIAISNLIAEWRSNDNQTVLCCHSLDVFLQYVTLEQAFQFVHKVDQHISNYDVLSHYHIDPTVTSEKEVNVFKRLTDSHVEVGADGELSITNT